MANTSHEEDFHISCSFKYSSLNLNFSHYYIFTNLTMPAYITEFKKKPKSFYSNQWVEPFWTRLPIKFHIYFHPAGQMVTHGLLIHSGKHNCIAEIYTRVMDIVMHLSLNRNLTWWQSMRHMDTSSQRNHNNIQNDTVYYT